MYHPTPETNDLILQFIQSPHDPFLQEQIAALKASGPEQSAYLEHCLEAWMEEEPEKPVLPAQVEIPAPVEIPVPVAAPVLTMPAAPVPVETPMVTAAPPPAEMMIAPAVTEPPVITAVKTTVVAPRAVNRKWPAAITAAVVLLAVVLIMLRWRRPVEMLVHTNDSGIIDSLVLGKNGKAVLNKTASITYPADFEKDPRITVLSGDVYFDLEQTAPVVFQLDDYTEVRTTGAVLNIHKTPATTQVFLIKGSAVVVKGTGEQIPLTASMLLKQDRYQPLQKKLMKSQAALVWRTGNLQFSEAPLEEILYAVSMYHNIVINVPPSANSLNKRRLTADFNNYTVTETIESLRDMLGVHIVKDSINVYYLTIK
ncbi:hypothetical protein [Chitinophaga nivalis]|uniref:FecR protein domain-containing protein n=1 Tax=Chitinophaga nivalis TaxID=2991709 RepID=A0ABT3IEZ2_9BACT|nr:hypothetical protein [Chitinophaga nivalis]MCW3467960.1 hypothetical protein [Chitinophaga nivalis]MCW3482349.1 hypothetical protein [Chitinophaga nivalis]